MATSPTMQLIQVIQDGQAQRLDYLKRADERGERQSRATLKALAAIQDSLKAIHEGQERIARIQNDVAALTQEALKASRESATRAAEILAEIRKN